MFPRAERFPGAKTPESVEGDRRQKELQLVTRAAGLDRRNRVKEIKERWERYYRRRSWIKPFLRTCRYVQTIPIEYRRDAYRSYLPFETIPRELIYGETIKVSSYSLDIWGETPKTKQEESTSSEISVIRTVEEPQQKGSKDGVGSAIVLNSTVKTLFGSRPSVFLKPICSQQQ